MDLAELDDLIAEQDNGRWLTVVSPDGEKLDGRILIAGPDSKRVREAQIEVANLRRGRTYSTVENLTADSLLLISRSVIDWDGFVKGGKPFPCSLENVKYLLGKVSWIREQVDAFGASSVNFYSRPGDPPPPRAVVKRQRRKKPAVEGSS